MERPARGESPHAREPAQCFHPKRRPNAWQDFHLPADQSAELRPAARRGVPVPLAASLGDAEPGRVSRFANSDALEDELRDQLKV